MRNPKTDLETIGGSWICNRSRCCARVINEECQSISGQIKYGLDTLFR